MSQKGQFTITGFTEVKSLTGDIGGPVGATLSNINVLGGTNIQTSGNPATSTVTFNLIGTTDHAVQIGNLAGGLTSAAVGLSGQFFAGVTGADPGWIGPLTDGQLFIGSTGADPVAATITAGANIGVANGAGTITIKVAGTTDHAVQVGNATNDLTSLAVGANGEVLIGNTGANPSWSATPTVTTVYATTFDTNVAAAGVTLSGTTLAADGTDVDIPINITTKGNGNVSIGPNSLTLATPLTVANGGTGANTLLIHGLLVGNTVGALNSVAVGATGAILTGVTAADPVWSAALTDGQLLVGSTGNAPVAATITAGANIGVANGAGTITVKVAGTTDHAVQVGNATNDLTSLAVGADGEVLVGNTGANPSWSATPTVTTLTATTLRTGNPAAAASCVTLSGTTLAADGTDANIGVTVTPKGTGGLTLSTGNFAASAGSVSANTTVTAGTNLVSTAGNLLLPTTSSTVGQIQINSASWAHAYGTHNIFMGLNSGNFTFNTAYNNGNIGIGRSALYLLAGAAADEGTLNTAVGYLCGTGLTTGYRNSFYGYHAGYQITTGQGNLCLGYNTGTGYTSSESFNITIGYSIAGTATESNTLRIGNGTGTGAGQINAAIVSGIYNINADAGGTPHAVYVGSGNQLGKNPSSIRFKENVVDLQGSEAIYKLRPVSFNYVKDPKKVKVSGLIAEEALSVLPELVGFDSDGKPDSVFYERLPVLLLSELKKLAKRHEEAMGTIEALCARVAELERRCDGC